MRWSALRLVVCVAQAGAFAPTFAQSGPEAAPGGASESRTRGDPAVRQAPGDSRAAGIGTKAPKDGFQRASNEIVNPARKDQADAAARRDAARRAEQAFARSVWAGP